MRSSCSSAREATTPCGNSSTVRRRGGVNATWVTIGNGEGGSRQPTRAPEIWQCAGPELCFRDRDGGRRPHIRRCRTGDRPPIQNQDVQHTRSPIEGCPCGVDTRSPRGNASSYQGAVAKIDKGRSARDPSAFHRILVSVEQILYHMRINWSPSDRAEADSRFLTTQIEVAHASFSAKDRPST